MAALALIAGRLAVGEFADRARIRCSREHAQPGRDIPPEHAVLVTADAKVFHVAGLCVYPQQRQTERTLTAKEAMEKGYVPCLRCLRKYLQTATSRDMRRWSLRPMQTDLMRMNASDRARRVGSEPSSKTKTAFGSEKQWREQHLLGLISRATI